MIERGKRQDLNVLRVRENGVYLGSETEAVLLPRAEVPEHTKAGDVLNVFVYLDSEDRPIATLKEVPIELGRVACLQVRQISGIGAFLNWGLMKDLFLPFREQRGELREGMMVPVLLYADKSGRLAATMKIYQHLATDSPYVKNDKVTGVIYEIKPELGAFVAVDHRYAGMIPAQEIFGELHVGELVEARVLKKRTDGKLDLSPRMKAYKQMDEDAEAVLDLIRSYSGVLPFNDKADPELIKVEAGLSKNAFKRALGRLLKEGKVEIGADSVSIIQEHRE